MILKDTPKRCGMFLYYDRHGLVDEYVLMMLKDMKKVTDYLMVIVNGYLETEAVMKLSGVCDKILMRANTGLDVGGYRDGIFQIGFDKLYEFDEFITFNYTIIPVRPLSSVVLEMESHNVDFWGLTRHHRLENTIFNPSKEYDYEPNHLQSHFWAIRRDMLLSPAYRDFIVNRENPNNYIESVRDYESIFTQHFLDLGYVGESYIDDFCYSDLTWYPLFQVSEKMVREKNCPIVKRKSFFDDYTNIIATTAGQICSELYDYLDKKTDFDVNLMWDNIIRLENMTDIRRDLHLNYMIENPDSADEALKNALFILALNNPPMIFYEEYIRQLPRQNTDIFVVGSEDTISAFKALYDGENISFIRYNENSYVSALKTVFSGVDTDAYDYIGVMNLQALDKKKDIKSQVAHLEFDLKSLWFTEKGFGNGFEIMGKNPRMGLLIPYSYRQGINHIEAETPWFNRFPEAKEILDRVKYSVNLNEKDNPLIPYTGNFIIKRELIGPITEQFDPEDFQLFILTLSSLVQSYLYYTGTAFSAGTYADNQTGQYHMLRTTNNPLVYLTTQYSFIDTRDIIRGIIDKKMAANEVSLKKLELQKRLESQEA